MGKKNGDEHDHAAHDHAGHDHDHAHDENCDHDDDIVTLVDADGNETDFAMLGTVEVDGDAFALLTPAANIDDDDDNMEVVLMHYEEDEDGGMAFSDIEDEALYARVQAVAEAAFAEDGDGEDGDGEAGDGEA
jgi:uncharacterized protein YrzB (UPF0473 family)